jgi:hypothetical protein
MRPRPRSLESRAGPNTLTLGSSVSLPRFAALLALQCGGEFDEKLDVLFFAANGSDGNVRSDGRLTESQTVDALAKHASPVFKAAARSVGDTGDVEWMKQAWRDVVRAHFARATGGSFCDASRFRALASEAMHVVSSLAEEEEADAPISGSGAETFPEYVASPRKTKRAETPKRGKRPSERGGGHRGRARFLRRRLTRRLARRRERERARLVGRRRAPGAPPAQHLVRKRRR